MHQPLSYVHPQAELADNVVVELANNASET